MNRNIRTDLALEMRECLHDESDGKISGVEILVEEDQQLGATVTWVSVENETGAQAMGKPIGNYITLEAEAMKENDPLAHEEITKILARKLGQLHKLGENAVVLVVGLGNRYVTPDALGPKVCEKILVTRHMGDATPPELHGKLRGVSAIAPGVMGITGIETAEIVKGVAEKVKPDLIIAIDALAARRTGRINATVQISDAGINPGAGMGNRRQPINQATMGVPVIAVGVPTVVDAATLVNDTMDKMMASMAAALEGSADAAFADMLGNLQGDERYGLITEILSPGNMFVTPKEVDAVMNRLANIVAGMLNIALHPGVTQEDVNRYL
ncbi:MAG: GPR endopeptidase [Defluviitaleaceae bacterium]|nr:GPR endopeptidase [Defluviitaleaceae bacterium]